MCLNGAWCIFKVLRLGNVKCSENNAGCSYFRVCPETSLKYRLITFPLQLPYKCFIHISAKQWVSSQIQQIAQNKLSSLTFDQHFHYICPIPEGLWYWAHTGVTLTHQKGESIKRISGSHNRKTGSSLSGQVMQKWWLCKSSYSSLVLSDRTVMIYRIFNNDETPLVCHRAVWDCDSTQLYVPFPYDRRVKADNNNDLTRRRFQAFLLLSIFKNKALRRL